MKSPSLNKLTILHYPDPVLRKICAPVEQFTPEIAKLAARMLELMHEAKGVGLAAPQVGASIRLFVCNTTGEPTDDQVCINPKLSDLSDAEEREEGCLSIPGIAVLMRRAVSVTIEASDVTGQRFQQTGEDLLARAWQHEADHLDGRLIIDAMSPTDEIANRRTLKQLEADYPPPPRRRKPPSCESSS